VVRDRIELSTFRFSGGLSPFCPPSRKRIISPAHLHFRWLGCHVPRHGHDTTSAAVCRGMPFCPCYFGIDLRSSPGLCCLCVGLGAPHSPGQPSRLRPGPACPARGPKTGAVGRPNGQPFIQLPLRQAENDKSRRMERASMDQTTHTVTPIRRVSGLLKDDGSRNPEHLICAHCSRARGCHLGRLLFRPDAGPAVWDVVHGSILVRIRCSNIPKWCVNRSAGFTLGSPRRRVRAWHSDYPVS
jgi:hypothetical protein